MDENTRSINAQLKRADRFENYREIRAKFNSIGACGHQVYKGDLIGWNRRYGVQCAECWRKWSAENAEASAVEAGYLPSCW